MCLKYVTRTLIFKAELFRYLEDEYFLMSSFGSFGCLHYFIILCFLSRNTIHTLFGKDSFLVSKLVIKIVT